MLPIVPHLNTNCLPKGIIDIILKEVNVPIVGDLNAGVA